MTLRETFAGDHEDPEMLAVMGGSVVEQRATLDRWGFEGTALIHLLSSCHGGCFFCSNRSLLEMPAAWITSAADVEARLRGLEAHPGLRRLAVGGTEPMTHPSLATILSRAAAAGLEVELMTSGVELVEAGRASALRDQGVRRVAVPLYAPRALLHDDVVGRAGQYDVVVAGLELASAAGIEVAVHTLALRRTLPLIPLLARRVRERWGGRLTIAPLRRKDDLFSYADESPSWRELEDVLPAQDVQLVGFPDCVAPEVPRGGPDVIRLYFRTQRLVQSEPCGACVRRAGCRGAVPAHLDVHGLGELRPFSG